VSRQTAPGDVTKLPLDRVLRPRRRWRIPRHRRRTTTAAAAAAAAASSSRRSDDCLHVGYMTNAPRDAPFIAQQHGQTPDTRLYRGKPLKNLGPLCTPFCRARCSSFASLMLNLHYVDLNLLKVTDINQSTAGPQQVRNMSTTNRRRLVEFERQRTNSGAEIIRLVSISS